MQYVDTIFCSLIFVAFIELFDRKKQMLPRVQCKIQKRKKNVILAFRKALVIQISIFFSKI